MKLLSEKDKNLKVKKTNIINKNQIKILKLVPKDFRKNPTNSLKGVRNKPFRFSNKFIEMLVGGEKRQISSYMPMKIVSLCDNSSWKDDSEPRKISNFRKFIKESDNLKAQSCRNLNLSQTKFSASNHVYLLKKGYPTRQVMVIQNKKKEKNCNVRSIGTQNHFLFKNLNYSNGFSSHRNSFRETSKNFREVKRIPILNKNKSMTMHDFYKKKENISKMETQKNLMKLSILRKRVQEPYSSEGTKLKMNISSKSLDNKNRRKHPDLIELGFKVKKCSIKVSSLMNRNI